MKKKILIIGSVIVLLILVVLSITSLNKSKIPNGNLNELTKHLDTFYEIDKIDKNSLGYALNQNIFIEIEEIKCNLDNTGKAKVTVTAPDLKSTLMKCITDIKDLEDYEVEDSSKIVENNMFDTLNSNNYEKVQTKLEVDIRKIDGTWKFLYDEEFGKAITCNMRELYKNAVKEMFRGE